MMGKNSGACKKMPANIVAAVFTFHAGKAVVEITAIEIMINHLLDIGPPEAVLPGEILVIDPDKGLTLILCRRKTTQAETLKISTNSFRISYSCIYCSLSGQMKIMPDNLYSSA